jgi:hypothetical protein
MRTQIIADDLTTVFDNMFSSIDGGIKGMTEALIQSLRRIATELAAKAAVFGILKLLFPEMMLGTSFGAFMGLSKVGAGTGGVIKAPVGLNVGSGKLEIVGKLSGQDILLSLNRTSRSMMNNT